MMCSCQLHSLTYVIGLDFFNLNLRFEKISWFYEEIQENVGIIVPSNQCVHVIDISLKPGKH